MGPLLVDFGEVHAISELQAGNLARPMLHFQIGLEQFDVDHLALHGGYAFGAHAVQGEIAVMGFDELAYDRIHDSAILEGAGLGQNPANTLERQAIEPYQDLRTLSNWVIG